MYQARDGKLALGEAATREAHKSGFVVLAPGFVPRRVGPGETDLALVPMGADKAAATLGATGGTLALAGRGLAVTVPANLVAAGTQAGLASYVPARGADEDAQAKAERDAFLARRGGADAACGAPLPCPPTTARLGLVMIVEGAMANGEIQARYDLAAMLRGWNGQEPAPWAADPAAWSEEARQAALGAARIQAVFRAIDATGDPTWRAQLASAYGITLVDGVLTFPVRLGDQAQADGFTRVEVDGLSVLGVRLEVTVVSTPGEAGTGAAGDLLGATGLEGTNGAAGPDGQRAGAARQPGLIANTGIELLPGRLLTHVLNHDGGSLLAHSGPGLTSHDAALVGPDGASIISRDGASIVSRDGASIVSRDGASIISRDGASLTHDGASLIGPDGASLVGPDGASLVGPDGASLVSNVGGSFAGVARLPEGLFDGADPGGPGAKYRLLSYPETPWAGTQVFAAHLGLDARAVTTDASGAFEIGDLPVSLAKVVPIAVRDGVRLATIAPAPRARRVQADLDAATTGVTLLVLKRAGLSGVQAVDQDGFAADVAWLRGQLTLAQARDLVREPFDVGAGLVDGLFTAAGRTPAALGVIPVGGASAGPMLPTAAPSNLPLPITPLAQAWVSDPTTVLTPGYLMGPAPSNTKFFSPKGLAAKGTSVVIADHVNNVVRMFNEANGMFQDVAGQPSSVDFPPANTAFGATSWRPRWLAFDPGRGVAYMTEGDENAGPNAINWVRTVSFSAGGITLLAGEVAAGHVDAVGAVARFNSPEGLALSPSGQYLYVADRLNHRIRRIDLAAGAQVSTHSGTGAPGLADGGSDVALFKEPRGLATDGFGDLYVVDAGNHAVRRVTTDGAVTTLVGTGAPGAAIGQGTATQLKDPVGCAYDSINHGLFIADAGNDRLVYVSLTAPYQAMAVTDGGTPAGGVRMTKPSHVAVVGRNVYVTMAGVHGVSKIPF